MPKISRCERCTLGAPLTNAIVSGKFGAYCAGCIAGTTRLNSTGSAQYHRDRDRENHQRDLIQPFLPDGTPNKEFIRQYPDESKGNFTQEELEKYS